MHMQLYHGQGESLNLAEWSVSGTTVRFLNASEICSHWYKINNPIRVRDQGLNFSTKKKSYNKNNILVLRHIHLNSLTQIPQG